MALAEALKGNTTLETLRPAALPSNPSGHACATHGKGSDSLHGLRVHPQCTLSPAPSLQPEQQRLRRRRQAGPQSGRAQRPQALSLAQAWVKRGVPGRS
eukprot:scaffold99570_cov55-Phaeocystis_antarctica.AAC.2